LNSQTDYYRALNRSLIVEGISTETEVHGPFLITTTVDDRVDINVRVARPRGEANVDTAVRGTTDTTTVEYRVNPYGGPGAHGTGAAGGVPTGGTDEERDRAIDASFRERTRPFDWDNQDRDNEDQEVAIVSDDG